MPFHLGLFGKRGRKTSRRTHRKTSRRTHRRTTRRKGKKLKFGSPAYRRKYLGHK